MSLIRKHRAVLQAWACLALVNIVEVHDTLGRPLFFLKSEGIQCIACRAMLPHNAFSMGP